MQRTVEVGAIARIEQTMVVHRQIEPVQVVGRTQHDQRVVARKANSTVELDALFAVQHVARSRKLDTRVAHGGKRSQHAVVLQCGKALLAGDGLHDVLPLQTVPALFGIMNLVRGSGDKTEECCPIFG